MSPAAASAALDPTIPDLSSPTPAAAATVPATGAPTPVNLASTSTPPGNLSPANFALLSEKRDRLSQAEPHRVLVRQVALDLTVDFAAKVVRGAAELSFDRPDATAPLVVDTLALQISAVTGSDGQPRAFSLGKADSVMGQALSITLTPTDRKVTIRYQTTAGSEALQWLAAAQTRDRKQPFVFTQGQSILTRSWIPLQDSPGIRITYEARVRVPSGITPVMSAEQLGRRADGAFHFRMKEPIPPYLIALAAGRLSFAAISPRAGVWAEPSLVKSARNELVDTEAMIAAAEQLFGPYRWGRYDIIVLPPSFPFGGMENPRLTFATPTILAGDKSLVGLVAHELAHSWSGNLVTNATWSDFWLNEGFTSYCEQRIMERVFGVERSNLEKSLSRDDLVREMADLEAWQQVLHPDLTKRHPDSAFSAVPYEKGSLLLQRLEQAYGRERFDRFLRQYFDNHAFQSISTGEFMTALNTLLLQSDPAAAARIDFNRWLLAAGLPDDAPRVQSTAIAQVETELKRFAAGTAPKDLVTKGWVTQQWQHFLTRLPADVSQEQIIALDNQFAFTKSGNSEILCEWFQVTIRRAYTAVRPALEKFLLGVGRRKFLKPLYTELAKTPEGLAWARDVYAKARPRYHAVATGTIDKILQIKAGGA